MSSVQPYVRAKGYHRVTFRYDTPLLHTELNEIQLREEDYRKVILRDTVGQTSTTNGFSVTEVNPLASNARVLIWPGELYVGGHIMILGSPLEFAFSATGNQNLWAKFVPTELDHVDDPDMVYPDHPITAHRFTYEFQPFALPVATNPTVAAGELIYLLATVNVASLVAHIAQTSITDKKAFWGNNYVLTGCEITVNATGNQINLSAGKIILEDREEIVTAETINISALSPSQAYVYYYISDNASPNPSPVFTTASAYPNLNQPILHLLSFTTDASSRVLTDDAVISDDRVKAPIEIIRDTVYSSSSASASKTYYGTATLNSTTGTAIDFSVIDPSGTLYPDFQGGNPTDFAVNVSVEGLGTLDLVGNIFVDYTEVTLGEGGFTIYNTGSDNFSSIRWTAVVSN